MSARVKAAGESRGSKLDGSFPMLPRKEVIRRHAGKVHKTVKASPSPASRHPIGAVEMEQSKARCREVNERAAGVFLAVNEETREFRETGVMSDDQQCLYGRRYLFQKILHCADIGVVDHICDFAGRFSRKFPCHDIERFARAPGWRNKGEFGHETGCMTISAHARRIGGASRRQ